MTPLAASASVLGREAMRALDARTIAAGTPALELMERAGRALAAFVAEVAGNGSSAPTGTGSRRLLVLAGRGNNGGDGFVVARLLAAEGWNATVALAGDEPDAGSDAGINLEKWRRGGGSVIGVEEARSILAAGATGFDVGLDAIFGTGLVRRVEGADAAFIHCLNESSLPVVSADIPSGLCSNSGRPLGVAVRARATLAIGAAKPGLFLADGPDYSGRVRVADIGLLLPSSIDILQVATVLDDRTMSSRWPRLPHTAHKGTRGHVLIVAGSRGKTGAAVLAARGALRAGAGLVTVASVAEVQAAVSLALPEAMTRLLAADVDGRVDAAASGALAAIAADVDAIVAGPGLGTGDGASRVIEQLLSIPLPLVLDADAITILAGWDPARRDGILAARLAAGAPPAVLTPHPGEMGRLAGQSAAEVQQARDMVASDMAKELGAVIVLKGAATIVCDGGRLAFNLSGNPGMGAAGMGDVLSGICGAIAARRTAAEASGPTSGRVAAEYLDPFERACLAVYVHGAAGDHLAREIGPGFLASELADRIPAELSARMPR